MLFNWQSKRQKESPVYSKILEMFKWYKKNLNANEEFPFCFVDLWFLLIFDVWLQYLPPPQAAPAPAPAPQVNFILLFRNICLIIRIKNTFALWNQCFLGGKHVLFAIWEVDANPITLHTLFDIRSVTKDIANYLNPNGITTTYPISNDSENAFF